MCDSLLQIYMQSRCCIFWAIYKTQPLPLRHISLMRFKFWSAALLIAALEILSVRRKHCDTLYLAWNSRRLLAGSPAKIVNMFKLWQTAFTLEHSWWNHVGKGKEKRQIKIKNTVE